jgi:hypothetical protein
MPQAVISVEPERFDLKSCPGGFVVLRRMPYGKYLARQEMALKLKVQAQQQKGGGRSNFEGEMAMANKMVTVFEFKECIVDHNLTDASDAPLNFSSEHTLEILDPRIGNEIGALINEMHDFDSGNSSVVSATPSSVEGNETTQQANPSDSSN